jgi:hypothetical protein
VRFAFTFGDKKVLNKPLILVFPQVVVCLDCGSAQFTVPKAELQLIKQSGKSGTEAAS